MDPTPFTPVQIKQLPPHRLVTYGTPEQPYRPLPTVALDGKYGRVVSRWTLTDAERLAIAAGEDLYLEQLTFGEKYQPILPTVGLRTFKPNDVGML